MRIKNKDYLQKCSLTEVFIGSICSFKNIFFPLTENMTPSPFLSEEPEQQKVIIRTKGKPTRTT